MQPLDVAKTCRAVIGNISRGSKVQVKDSGNFVHMQEVARKMTTACNVLGSMQHDATGQSTVVRMAATVVLSSEAVGTVYAVP